MAMSAFNKVRLLDQATTRALVTRLCSSHTHKNEELQKGMQFFSVLWNSDTDFAEGISTPTAPALSFETRSLGSYKDTSSLRPNPVTFSKQEIISKPAGMCLEVDCRVSKDLSPMRENLERTCMSGWTRNPGQSLLLSPRSAHPSGRLLLGCQRRWNTRSSCSIRHPNQ